MTGGTIIFDDIYIILYVLVPHFSVIFSRSAGGAVTTSRTFPIGILNAAVARPYNAVVVRSSFRTTSGISDVSVVL